MIQFIYFHITDPLRRSVHVTNWLSSQFGIPMYKGKYEEELFFFKKKTPHIPCSLTPPAGGIHMIRRVAIKCTFVRKSLNWQMKRRSKQTFTWRYGNSSFLITKGSEELSFSTSGGAVRKHTSSNHGLSLRSNKISNPRISKHALPMV